MSALNPVCLKPTRDSKDVAPRPAQFQTDRAAFDSLALANCPVAKGEGSIRVEVTNPIHNGSHASYLLSYQICITCDLLRKKLLGRCVKRYRDFYLFWENLVRTYQHICPIPPLPPKSIVNRFDESFLNERCNALDHWIKAVARNPRLDSSLLEFLRADSNQPVENSILHRLLSPLADNYLLTAAEKQCRKWVCAENAPKHQVEVGAEQDYWHIRKIMQKFKLTSLKLLLPKFVTLLLGSTSSGKSAFLNHLYGAQLQKSSEHQQDTEFTLIEVIPYEEFWAMHATKERVMHRSQMRQYVSADDIRPIDSSQLLAPIKDYDSDWRLGRVFNRLNSEQTTTRYEQLRQYATKQMFSACLVNEAALDKDSIDFEFVKKVIFIDSPGFLSVQTADIVNKCMNNLKLLQCLYNTSDLLLYFLPSGQIPTLANQLPMLELSLIYANYGERVGDEVVKDLFLHQKERTTSNLHFFSLGVSAIASALVKEARRLACVSKPSLFQQQKFYRGGSIWRRTLFVLSKIDRLVCGSQSPTDWSRALIAQYYELGVLLGKSLVTLETPVHDRCLAIGIPEHQQMGGPPQTGDLELLKAKMVSYEREAPYLHRLEGAIQTMCDELEERAAGGYKRWAYMSLVKKLRARSHKRSKRLIGLRREREGF